MEAPEVVEELGLELRVAEGMRIGAMSAKMLFGVGSMELVEEVGVARPNDK